MSAQRTDDWMIDGPPISAPQRYPSLHKAGWASHLTLPLLSVLHKVATMWVSCLAAGPPSSVFASSVEPMGEFWLRQFAKYMI